MLPIEKINSLEYKTTMANCKAVPITAALPSTNFPADANIFQETAVSVELEKKKTKSKFRIYMNINTNGCFPTSL